MKNQAYFMDSFPIQSSRADFLKRLLFYTVWGGLLLATLVPVKSIIYWYEQVYQAHGGQITGPISAGASDILPFIRHNISSFFLQLLAIGSRALFNWLLVSVIFGLFLSRLSLPAKVLAWVEGLVDKIKTVEYKKLLFITLLLTLLITSAFSYRIHWFFPDYPDNVVQLYQAKLFKQGKIHIPPPEGGIDFFWYPLLITKADRWYPRYEPGYPFLLMLGLFIGMPWLVNPILGCLSLIIIYKLGCEVYDDVTARLGLMLLMLSPFFLTVSSGFLNNAPAMFFALLGIYYFVKTLKYPGLTNPIISGMSLGAIANIRPLTSFLVTLPLGVYVLFLLFKRPRIIAPKFAAACFGLSLTISVLLYYNYLANGHPLLFGQTAMVGKVKTMGFGISLYKINHTPFRALVRLLEKLNQMNFSLFGWPIPSLAFIFLFFLPVYEKNRWDYLFLSVILCMIPAYSLFVALKVRYFYALIPLLVLLTARGLVVFWGMLKRCGFLDIKIKSAVYIIVPIFIGYMAYTSLIPQLVANGKEKHLVYRLVKQQGIHNAIVFLISGFSGWGIYTQGFVHNEPGLDGDIIYAHYRGENSIKLMQQYPERSYYFFDRKADGTYRFLQIGPGDYPKDYNDGVPASTQIFSPKYTFEGDPQ
jgi:hypothetical protein